MSRIPVLIQLTPLNRISDNEFPVQQKSKTHSLTNKASRHYMDEVPSFSLYEFLCYSIWFFACSFRRLSFCREEWYGMLYSWADSKKKSNLMLSPFVPGRSYSARGSPIVCDMGKWTIRLWLAHMCITACQYIREWLYYRNYSVIFRFTKFHSVINSVRQFPVHILSISPILNSSYINLPMLSASRNVFDFNMSSWSC